MLKKRKKIIVFSLMIIIFVTVIVGALVLFSQKPQNKSNIQYDSSSIIFPTAIDKISTPMVYDYSRGSLGQYWGHNFNNIANFYAILIPVSELNSTKTSGSFFIQKYSPIDFYPPESTGYKEITLDGSSWTNAKINFSNWDTKYQFKEKQYKLFIIIESEGNKASGDQYFSSSKGQIWANIDLSSLKFPASFAAQHQKEGIDTIWLRKVEYKKELESNGVNISSKFFDKYNMLQVITVARIKNLEETIDIVVVGEDSFVSRDGGLGGTKYTVNKDLNTAGYNQIP